MLSHGQSRACRTFGCELAHARLALEALHPSMERRALVIGGGAIGLAAALALKAMGARDVTIAEPNDARRAFLAETCGQATMANALAVSRS